MKKANTNFWIIMCIVMISSFILLLAGVKLLLGNPITAQNLIAYLILSFIFSVVSSTLYLLKRKIAFVLFIAGLVIGFFEMSRMFLSDLSGWGDLVGLMSLFTWAAIGLGSGAAAELCRFIYKKINPGHND